MAPRHKSVAENQDVLATTHHNLSVVDEEMEEESVLAATRRDPAIEDNELEEPAAPASAKVAADKAKRQQQQQQPEIDISLRIHEKVAKVASKAYRKACAKSSILSLDKLAGIGLVKYDHITVGQLLGKGSFSNVYEITRIGEPAAGLKKGNLHKSFRQITYDESSDDNGNNADVDADEDKEAIKETSQFLEKNYERRTSKTFRYAIKYLKDDILSSPNSYAVGTVDLVVEGMFLASLTHPNIIKVRGLPEGGVDCLLQPNAKGYFLILDRLFDTLTEKIYNVWQVEHRSETSGGGGGCLCLPFGSKNSKAKEEEKLHLSERLKVAFDISAALKFLHGKSIIYRDIKPENLGFDSKFVCWNIFQYRYPFYSSCPFCFLTWKQSLHTNYTVRGDIKLFDLGLVKELSAKNKKKDGTYKLSMAGTPRYMAPECGKRFRYNLSADVYSFSVLLWEIITMRQPLEDFTYSRLQKEVFDEGYRPNIKAIKNKNMRELVRAGWDQDASKRPAMETMYEELKAELILLCGSEVAEQHLSHDRRRSTLLPPRLSAVDVKRLLRSSEKLDED